METYNIDYKRLWEESHRINDYLIQENKRLKAKINKIITKHPKILYLEELEKKGERIEE